MKKKRHLIHCLLALAVGLLPVPNAGAISVDHSNAGFMECLDCASVETDLDNSCQNKACYSIAPTCGSHASANFLPSSASIEHVPNTRFEGIGRDDAEYRQNLTDPIYRPPIA